MSYGLDRASFNQGQNAKYDFSVLDEEQPTITAKGPGAVCSRQSAPFAMTITKESTISMSSKRSSSTHTHTHGAGGTMDNYVVRRLTPLECTRLQGFPNGWVDIGDWTDSKGKVHKESDSVKYKALGNSIATGDNSFWKFLLKRIIAQYDYDPTMASLFDGIGGFPLLWEQLSGIGNTLWASEIEEFPIAVTKQHFPCMEHLGDITKINGAEAPIVDCIIGGSPCQDLSVAGKRAGLDGERSGLFMEQIRIIKEMRANDMARGRTGQFIRPRYGVWENVPGAFSSNKGEDFRAVIEEFCKVSGGVSLFLNLTSGQETELSWEKDSAWLGQYMMQKTGVYPKEGREYLLSQILEDNPLPKYCLSARACQGILNRAERRGKILPEILETALRTTISNASVSKNEQENPAEEKAY